MQPASIILQRDSDRYVSLTLVGSGLTHTLPSVATLDGLYLRDPDILTPTELATRALHELATLGYSTPLTHAQIEAAIWSVADGDSLRRRRI